MLGPPQTRNPADGDHKPPMFTGVAPEPLQTLHFSGGFATFWQYLQGIFGLTTKKRIWFHMVLNNRYCQPFLIGV